MVKEQSYGAVCYKSDENHHLLFLIEHMSLGHFSLPKGHIEANETPLETTIREIKEETNLDVIVDTNFKRTITYSPRLGAIKDVTFFVAKITSNKVIAQKSEVQEVLFLPFDKALKTLTHASDKDVLKAANNYILKHQN